MTETFLDGKLTVTSLAAPTAEDNEKLNRLTKEEREQVLFEALERGRKSGISTMTREEIWQAALEKAKSKQQSSESV